METILGDAAGSLKNGVEEARLTDTDSCDVMSDCDVTLNTYSYKKVARKSDQVSSSNSKVDHKTKEKKHCRPQFQLLTAEGRVKWKDRTAFSRSSSLQQWSAYWHLELQ